MKHKPLLILAVAILSWGNTVSAVPFSPSEKNVEALNESLLMTTSMLTQTYGVAPTTLSYSGSFLDTSWNAGLSGNYAGMSLNLSFNGTFDIGLDQGSFISTGTLGTASWDGVGTWSFTDVDAQSIDMSWDSEATITPLIGSIFKPDKHFTVPKRWARSSVGDVWHIADYGKYRSTIFGIPFGPEKQEISDWIIPKDGPQNATVTVSLPEDFIILRETANFDNGTVSGTLTVPEPPTYLLMLLGFFGLARRRVRLAYEPQPMNDQG